MIPKWIKLTITDELNQEIVSTRAELPDLSHIEGPMGIQGVLEPRMYALSQRVLELVRSRGYKPMFGWEGNDGNRMGCKSHTAI